MAIEPTNPIFNIGDLAKPAVVLIEKVSDAVGSIYKPSQIRKVAKAEAEAALIRAKVETQVTDLQRRAAHRWLQEEAIHQKNMEDIIAKAISLLKDDANPAAMGNDWIANFFAKTRFVSDSEMQDLWARILAGEANAPDTFSRRTVNVLSILDKGDAEAFAKLCGFVWVIETKSETEVLPLVFDFNAAIYERNGADFVTLNNLESIGLLRFDQNAGLSFYSDRNSGKLTSQEKFIARHFGRELILDMTRDVDISVRIGHTFFTNTGKELARICQGKPVDGFYEYVKEQWKQYLTEVVTGEDDKIGAGYAILDDLVGFVESDSTDGSVNHDDLIYDLQPKP
jgi:hypothetical protein